MAPAQEPEVVGQILAIPVADIVQADRLRPIDPVWAAALGGIMAAEGQHSPIEVCRLPGQRSFLLVSGGHRLRGAQLQGWKTINAVVVDNGVIERRQHEISENLWRRQLDPIDRAAFIAELISLRMVSEGLDPQRSGRSVSANIRWQKALKDRSRDASAALALAYGWAEETADLVGLSRRTIYNDLALHRGLRPDVATQLRTHPLGANSSQLRMLAKLSEADQRAVVELLLAGEARNVPDALGIIQQKPKPDPQTKAWSAFFGGWSRMSTAMRRDALRALADQGLPRGVTIKFGGNSDQ